MDEALSVLREVTGRALRIRYLPGGLIAVAAGLAWLPYRLIGRRAPVCPEMVRTLRHGHTYDGSSAANELGLEYTPAASTLGRLVEWAADQGLLVK